MQNVSILELLVSPDWSRKTMTCHCLGSGLGTIGSSFLSSCYMTQKCTCLVLARFTSLLFAMRTSTVATAYKKVTINTSTHNLTISSLKWKSSSFPVVYNKLTQPRFLPLAIFFSCLLPEKPRDIAFIPSVLERVPRWRVLWIRSIAGCISAPVPLLVLKCRMSK